MFISVEIEDGGFLSTEDRASLLRFCKDQWLNVRFRHKMSHGFILVRIDILNRWQPLFPNDSTIQLGQHPSGTYITKIIRVEEG